MAIVLRHRDQLADRVVETQHYRTTRLLLRDDGVGATVTDIIIKAGSDAEYSYPHHLEIAYCVAGRPRMILADGAEHDVTPGFLWAAAQGERFRFVAGEDTRLSCFFQPPREGAEVNDPSGGFAASPAREGDAP